MIVRTVITIILSVYAMVLAAEHNIHMFQLNGYKNDEHLNWTRKNLRQQWLLWFGLLFGIIRVLLQSLVIDIIIYLTLIMEILVYRAMKRLNTKKKLVFTARVKRLIVTIAVLSAAFVVCGIIFLGFASLSGVLIITAFLQIIFVIIANLINYPIEHSISTYYINDAKKKLKESPDLKIIGITGSYGKTSVKYYLETLLSAKYNVLVTPGNYNTPLGVTKTVRELLNPTHEVFICEMGARRTGQIKELCDLVHPHIGIITSVGPQHLETFHGMENVIKTKFELADAIPADSMIFLNGDNEYISGKAPEYKNAVMYYSDEADDGYYAKDIKLSSGGTDFTVVTPDGETETYQMKLIGGHNVINVVGAIAVAHKLGIGLKELKIPVRRIESVEHRMQIKNHGRVTIIDDAYNSNPIGSKAAVETLSMFDGVKILITPGMIELGEKEKEYNYKFGTYAASCCDYILLVGKKRTEPIYGGATDSGFDKEKCIAFDRLEEALSYAYSIKKDGHKYILLENDLPDNY